MAGRDFRVGSFLREHALGCAVLVAGLFWGLDALVHSSGGEERFLEHLLSTQPHHLMPRLLAVVLVFGLGLQVRNQVLRGRAEAQVRASERRFRTLASASPVGVLECDAAGRIVYLNERASALLGLPLSECLGDGYAAALHEDDRQRVLDSWGEARRQGRRFREECRFSHPGGGVVWAMFEAAALRDDAGGISGFIGTITDITERVRVETELAERTRLAELSAAIGLILAEGMDLSGMLRRCAQTIVTHPGVLFARIWLYDAGAGVLVLRASEGRYTRIDGDHARIQLGSTKIGVIGAMRRPLLTNQVAGDPLISDQEWARREGVTAFAGNPLLVGEALIGVVGMFSRRPFSPATSDWLATVAGEIALGVQRKVAEEEIRIAGEEWARTFDAMPDLVFTVASDYRIVKANRAMQARLGLKQDGIVGRRCYEVMHGTTEPPENCPHRLAKADGREHSVEVRDLRLGGDFLLSVSPIVGGPGCPGGIVHVVRDVSERRKFEERLEAAAYTDELTGLFNRRGFFTLAGKQLEIAARSRAAVGLVFMDVDRMKEINDRWGHEEGDRALRDVAGILHQTFRKSDILGRLGGDEFVAFLPDVAGADAERIVLSTLQQRLADHNARAERPFTLAVSAGLAVAAPGVPCDLEELLTRGDRDMYREKMLGRGAARPAAEPRRPTRPTRLTSRIITDGVAAELTPGGAARLVDISLGGACVGTALPLRVGDSHGLRIPGGAGNGLALSGAVVWAGEFGVDSSDGRRFRSGLRFVDVGGEQQGALVALLVGNR